MAQSRHAVPPVLQLLADDVIDATTLITHRFGMHEAGAALARLDEGQGIG